MPGFFEKDDPKARNTGKIPRRMTAVALQESAKKGYAPRVTAAGRGSIAEKILEIAFAHGIRVREDAALAEMLTKVEIDSPIPSEAFMAVAEILAYVYRANGRPNPFDMLIKDDQAL
ncbi:MAG: EscU/YscU/HrcU family type III secretion system export apparatus switch protein [Alphaproteobacteria bacterium]|nr:EscU/YscU/HrcU family type III secretion system export apparatus switch protein [Alphaproteobacteria bacterium]